jgi:hypothetical protein
MQTQHRPRADAHRRCSARAIGNHWCGLRRSTLCTMSLERSGGVVGVSVGGCEAQMCMCVLG